MFKTLLKIAWLTFSFAMDIIMPFIVAWLIATEWDRPRSRFICGLYFAVMLAVIRMSQKTSEAKDATP